MDADKTIAEIELLEHLLTLPDKRPLKMSDWKAANRKHDETYATNPWFRLVRRDRQVLNPKREHNHLLSRGDLCLVYAIFEPYTKLNGGES